MPPLQLTHCDNPSNKQKKWRPSPEELLAALPWIFGKAYVVQLIALAILVAAAAFTPLRKQTEGIVIATGIVVIFLTGLPFMIARARQLQRAVNRPHTSGRDEGSPILTKDWIRKLAHRRAMGSRLRRHGYR